MGKSERNQAARKLLAYFFAGYEEVGDRNFSISPQDPEVLKDLGWDRAQYDPPMSRLIDKGLLEPFTLGGGCRITDLGVEASEDDDLLDELLPVDKPTPAASPVAGAMQDFSGHEFEYDIALSFAGEDRGHAEALADLLKSKGVRVFYDMYEQADLWGKDLYEHLHNVYSKKARYCAIFCSEAYVRKVWTDHERRSAQERAMAEKGTAYILPIRLDATEVPGIRKTVGYVDISLGAPRIADLVLTKLGKLGGGPPTANSPALATNPHKVSVRNKILDTFSQFKIAADDILPQNSIDCTLHQNLTPPEDRVFDEVVEDMVKEGLMREADGGLGGWFLTEAVRSSSTLA
jgi:hypothetical protein